MSAESVALIPKCPECEAVWLPANDQRWARGSFLDAKRNALAYGFGPATEPIRAGVERAGGGQRVSDTTGGDAHAASVARNLRLRFVLVPSLSGPFLCTDVRRTGRPHNADKHHAVRAVMPDHPSCPSRRKRRAPAHRRTQQPRLEQNDAAKSERPRGRPLQSRQPRPPSDTLASSAAPPGKPTSAHSTRTASARCSPASAESADTTSATSSSLASCSSR